jgi:hypothetical protein
MSIVKMFGAATFLVVACTTQASAGASTKPELMFSLGASGCGWNHPYHYRYHYRPYRPGVHPRASHPRRKVDPNN